MLLALHRKGGEADGPPSIGRGYCTICVTQRYTAPMIAKLANTYSIVAVDTEREEMGVAVQSHVFSVGSIVPWGEAGVGVVATQALANIDFGPQALALMRTGMLPTGVIPAILAADSGAEYRQLAVATADGSVAGHTGERCIREAGHVGGDGVICAANMMERDTVWKAMLAAYEASEGALAARLLGALEAAEAEGGDIRGKQSAAILVLSTRRRRTIKEERLVDIRVEDHHRPLDELRRLLRLHTAYSRADKGDDALAAGDIEAAETAYGEAFNLYPESEELRYWMALGLATAGDLEEAEKLLRPLYASREGWRELTNRLRDTGLFDLADEAWERLTR